MHSGIVLLLLASCALSAPAQTPLSFPPNLKSWSLSESPTLRIGAEGDPNTEFTRITGVVRLPTGEIVVANSGTVELRLFSATGAFLQTLSRRGEGPGELRGFSVLSRVRDTLFVIESFPGPNQLHVFTVPGGFRTRTLLRASNAPSGVSATARLTNGMLLVTPGRGFRAVQSSAAGTVTRDSISLGLLQLGDPGEVTWLGQHQASSYFWYTLASNPDRTVMGMHTLGPTLVTGATADRVWIGDSGTGEITVFGGVGKQVGRVTLPMPLRAFSGDALDRARKRAVESARNADDRARFDALYDKSVRPRTAPAFTRFVAGPDGEMWVELFAEDPASPRRFVAFDRAGRAVAGVVVPPAVKLHEVGPDYILGVHTDDDGIERVVQYRLRRS